MFLLGNRLEFEPTPTSPGTHGAPFIVQQLKELANTANRKLSRKALRGLVVAEFSETASRPRDFSPIASNQPIDMNSFPQKLE